MWSSYQHSLHAPNKINNGTFYRASPPKTPAHRTPRSYLYIYRGVPQLQVINSIHYIVIYTNNHRIQPLISQLNAILGAPSCVYIYMHHIVYIYNYIFIQYPNLVNMYLKFGNR